MSITNLSYTRNQNFNVAGKGARASIKYTHSERGGKLRDATQSPGKSAIHSDDKLVLKAGECGSFF